MPRTDQRTIDLSTATAETLALHLVASVVEAFEQGTAIAEIARQFGIREVSVTRALRFSRINPANGKPLVCGVQLPSGQPCKQPAAGESSDWENTPLCEFHLRVAQANSLATERYFGLTPVGAG